MATEREALVTVIRDALASGPARTARELASILRARPQIGDVHRRDVNSILYRELSGTATHDDEYRWSLHESDDVPREGTVHATRPDEIPSQRPELLRAISRLRSGLPPQERILDVTIGAEKLMLAVERIIDSDSPDRWLLVSGNYGDGKSHSLALVADMARSTGLATCHLSADGAGAALNHPQRFLPQLLASLEVPGRTRNGYEDLLHQVLLDPQEARTLRDIASRLLTAGRQLDAEVVHAVGGITGMHSASGDFPGEFAGLARLIAFHLTGESISHRPGTPAARELVYLLLRLATELLSRLGVPGLVIVVDEAESIFTKLPNARSRRGAFRVISALSISMMLPRCRIAMAMTPDGWRGLVAAVGDMNADADCLPVEPVRELGAAIAAGTIARIACQPPRSRHRTELLDRVRALYALTYPGALGAASEEALWRDFVGEGARVDLPIRLLVRKAIDHLDRVRFGAGPRDPAPTRRR